MKSECKFNKDILLSIIIPIYNVERYLPECLDSVLYNNTKEIELILVNDGSTDNSDNICKQYAIKDSRIIFITQENAGLSEARNTGIRNSKGKYLLFLDSDDYLEKGILKKILKDIETEDKDFFVGRATKVDGEYSELCQVDYMPFINMSPQEVFLKLDSIKKFWFAAWLIIIKRDFLLSNDLYFFKGILHEDELWVPLVFIKASAIGFLNYSFYCYRINRIGSIVTNKNIKREYDKLFVADQLGNLYSDSHVGNQIITQRRAAIIFGIIKNLATYKNQEDYFNLVDNIRLHIKLLKYKKYKFVYLIYRIIGISKLSKLIKKKW